MGKLNQLSGVAHNISDRFISGGNIHFLHFIESQSQENVKSIQIDLLKVTIEPKDLMNRETNEIIQQYNHELKTELKKLKIELSDIVKVIINIQYHLTGLQGKYYTASTIISAKGKEYTGKAMSFY